MTCSILSKGVSLFQISSDSKKHKKRRDDTVLGRLKERVRNFVYQDALENTGGDALNLLLWLSLFVAACRFDAQCRSIITSHRLPALTQRRCSHVTALGQVATNAAMRLLSALDFTTGKQQ
jgi:hypothetical protein